MHLFLMLMILALACENNNTEMNKKQACWKNESVNPVEETLDNDDSCMIWALSIDEHAYINVSISNENIECNYSIDTVLTVPYDPTYSAMGSEGPKWTFDIQAIAYGEGTAHIVCEDQTVWWGHFIVE